jgi:hypothetical protein
MSENPKSLLFPLSKETPDSMDHLLTGQEYLQKQITETRKALLHHNEIGLSGNDITALMLKFEQQEIAEQENNKTEKVEIIDRNPGVEEIIKLDPITKNEHPLAIPALERDEVKETEQVVVKSKEGLLFSPIPLTIETLPNKWKSFYFTANGEKTKFLDPTAKYFKDKEKQVLENDDENNDEEEVTEIIKLPTIDPTKPLKYHDADVTFSWFRNKYLDANLKQNDPSGFIGQPSSILFETLINTVETLKLNLSEFINSNEKPQSYNNDNLRKSRNILNKILYMLETALETDGIVTEKTIEYLKRDNDGSKYDHWFGMVIKSTVPIEPKLVMEKPKIDYENTNINEVEGTITIDHIFAELKKHGITIDKVMQSLELERIKNGRKDSYIGIFPLQQSFNENKGFTQFDRVNGVLNTAKSPTGSTYPSFLEDFKTVIVKLLPNATVLAERISHPNVAGVETKNIAIRLNEQFSIENS